MSATEESRAAQSETAKTAENEKWWWDFCVLLAQVAIVCFLCLTVLSWVAVYPGKFWAVQKKLASNHAIDLEMVPICARAYADRNDVRFEELKCPKILAITWWHFELFKTKFVFAAYGRRLVYEVLGNVGTCIRDNLLYIGAVFVGIWSLNSAYNMFNNMFGWVPSLPDFLPKK